MTASQKDFEIVLALEPLNTLFGQLTDDKSTIYCEKLRAYPLDVVRKAVKETQSKFEPFGRVTYPPIATLIKACEAAAKVAVPVARNYGDDEPWIKREHDRKSMVDEYVKKFMQSKIALEAIGGGYDYAMQHYVREVASVQAQLILGFKNIGLSWHVITIQGMSRVDSERYQRNFLNAQLMEMQANNRQILVLIPHEKISEWKERAALELNAARYRNAPKALLSKSVEKQLLATRAAMTEETPEPPQWIDEQYVSEPAYDPPHG